MDYGNAHGNAYGNAAAEGYEPSAPAAETASHHTHAKDHGRADGPLARMRPALAAMAELAHGRSCIAPAAIAALAHGRRTGIWRNRAARNLCAPQNRSAGAGRASRRGAGHGRGPMGAAPYAVRAIGAGAWARGHGSGAMRAHPCARSVGCVQGEAPRTASTPARPARPHSSRHRPCTHDRRPWAARIAPAPMSAGDTRARVRGEAREHARARGRLSGAARAGRAMGNGGHGRGRP
jgi:hypothetical protein